MAGYASFWRVRLGLLRKKWDGCLEADDVGDAHAKQDREEDGDEEKDGDQAHK